MTEALGSENAISREQIVEVARGWIGTPYRHQGSLKDVATDCLGLIRGVWREIYGTEPEPITPYTANWAEESQTENLRDAARRHMIELGADQVMTGDKLLDLAQPGDLILLRVRDRGVAKHAAIISRPGFIIHAYDRHAVMETAIPQAWRRRVAYAFQFPGVV